MSMPPSLLPTPSGAEAPAAGLAGGGDPLFQPPVGRERRGPGIAIRLFGVLLLVSLVPLALVGAWMLEGTSDAMKRSVRDVQLAVISDITRSIATSLLQTRQELEATGEILLGDGDTPDAVRQAQAIARMRHNPLFDQLVVYAPTGELVLYLQAPEALLGPPEAVMPPQLKAGLQEAPFVTGQVTTDGTTPRVLVGIRVMVGEELRAYLVTGLSLASLCQVLKQVSDDRFGGVSDRIYVLDEHGRIIAHADQTRAALLEDRRGRGILRGLGPQVNFRHRFGSVPQYFDEQGHEWLGALETLPDLGWAVAVEHPHEQVYATVYAMRRRLLLGALGAGLGMLVVAALVARRVTRPLRSLVTGIRSLAGREFRARVPVERTDELGTLATAFNDMASALETSEATLARESRIRADLSRYLSPEVVEEVIHHPEKLRLGGERRVVTVLFADISGFLSLAERLPPETLVAILNELFTIGTEIVMRRGGIVDKFIGDCIMAVFGVPEPLESHARAAVLAAEDLLRWLEAGNRRWEKTYGVTLSLTIGIHSGPVVAGNIGSEKRLEYTVIGDTVNVASRLESLARPGQILVSEATRQALGDEFECEAAGLHTVSGRSGATLVFRINPG